LRFGVDARGQATPGKLLADAFGEPVRLQEICHNATNVIWLIR
jgi:hypothetical protein